MMIIARQATCYIFTLTAAEQAQVHSSDALRLLEVSFFIFIDCFRTFPNLISNLYAVF